jgi:superfamily II DNA or RNA helicase
MRPVFKLPSCAILDIIFGFFEVRQEKKIFSGSVSAAFLMPTIKKCPPRQHYDVIERRCLKTARKTERSKKAGKRLTKTARSATRDSTVFDRLERVERKAQKMRALAKEAAKAQKAREAELERKRADLRKRFRKWASTIERPWTMRQGETGFNLYAYKRMVAAGLPHTMRLGCEKVDGERAPMAYQSTVAFLARPVTGVERLLVIARTGAGKTFTMIQVLDNMYFDTRPKAVIFPNRSVATNFYSELLDFPSKWRDLVRKRLGASPSIDAVHSLLASSRSGAPSKLVSFSYARAGGTGLEAAFHKKNFDGCVVIMDEAHNLVAPGKDMARYKKQLSRLREGLGSARGSMVLGFTATPFVNDVAEGEELLRIIKGPHRSASDEGFVTFFNEMPRQLYPAVIPNPDTDNDLSLVINVDPAPAQSDAMDKHDNDLRKLTHKKKLEDEPVEEFIFGPRGGKKKNPALKYTKRDAEGEYLWHEAPEKVMHNPRVVEKGQNYATIDVYYTQVGRQKTAARFKNDKSRAPKIELLLKYLEHEKKKSLILVERGHGFKAVADMIEDNVWCHGRTSCSGAVYEAKTAKKMLDRFNAPSNIDGKELMYMVADAKEFSEGVSFFGVRSIFLVNPPRTYSRYLQQIGRALRACNSHKSLPSNEQTLVIYCLITNKSMDVKVYERIENEGVAYRAAMKRFKDVAVDRRILSNFFDSSSEKRSGSSVKVDQKLTEDPETPAN